MGPGLARSVWAVASRRPGPISRSFIRRLLRCVRPVRLHAESPPAERETTSCLAAIKLRLADEQGQSDGLVRSGAGAVEAHLAELAAAGRASPAETRALRNFARDGYLTLPEALDADLLARLNADLDDAVARQIDVYEWGSSQRICNMHLSHAVVRELWLHPKVLRMLELIFGVPGRPCQSLTFVFGSHQDPHQDTVHLTSFPAGRISGAWAVLEDVQEDSGELVVFPGSHRLARIYMDTLGAPKITDEVWEPFLLVVRRWAELVEGLKPEIYRPKAGSILIWHGNLMHGGSVRNDAAKSRRLIVTHYFTDGAIAYYDSSGESGVICQGEPGDEGDGLSP